MALTQSLLTPQVIAKEALMHVKNNSVFIKDGLVHTAYKNEFVKIGNKVTVRKPPMFQAVDGPDITSSGRTTIVEPSTEIEIAFHKTVAWDYSVGELTLDLNKYSKSHIQGAAIQLSNAVDVAMALQYKYIPNAVGTAGTSPSTFETLGDLATRLDDMACPVGNRRLILNPKANWKMANALKGLFLADTVRELVKGGKLGNLAGMDIYTDQNIQVHTAGTCSGALVKTTMDKDTADLGVVTSDTGTGTLKAGDIITIAGVYAVNPVSKAKLDFLRQFTVLEDVADVSNGSIKISPKICMSDDIVQGPAYQNVSKYPEDGDAITVIGDHTANMAFHRNALALCTVPIQLPDSCNWKSQVEDDGISISLSKGYDINTLKETVRLDIKFGVKVLAEDQCCRLLG